MLFRSVSGTVISMTEKHHRDWLKSIGAKNASLDTIEKYYKGMYNDSEAYQRLKLKNRDAKLLDRIKTEYNLSIHKGRQGKHVKGHNNYAGKSYLLDGIDPQELVNQYAETGEIKRDRHGKWVKKQFFVHDIPIGMVKNKDGKYVATRRFSISYSKKGTHIIPRLEM